MTETENNHESTEGRVSRRDFLKYSAGVAAVISGASGLLGKIPLPPSPTASPTRISQTPPNPSIEEVTIAQLEAQFAAGTLTATSLVNMYKTRIGALDQSGPRLNSILQINPDALTIARQLDAQTPPFPGLLHRIPVLLKDNIDTHDQMQTTAGSLALVGAPAQQDSTVAAHLREAGAIILGKTNLSEWANFRSFFSSSGWSGRGGQCNNPYAIDRNPCGSSSGSGAAASGNLATVSIGTETDGSIVCPANANGVVGIKPTVGLVSRAGVIPISHTQDTVGPHARTVADAATVLTAIVQRTPDLRDPATSTSPLGKLGQPRPALPADYRVFLNPKGLKGARIGVVRDFEGSSPHADAIFDSAVTAIQNAGAALVDPVSFPHLANINSGLAEFTVLLFDFKIDIENYLKTRTGVPITSPTLQALIDFNNAHADQEMPFFAQEIFDLANTFSSDPNATQTFGLSYNESLAIDRKIGATEGIDKLLNDNNLDALIAGTDNPAWPTDLINSDHFVFGTSSPAAIVGYPIINVPAGMTFGVPVGISFIGTAFGEPTLIKLASGFEAVTQARQKPQFLQTLPFSGPPPFKVRGRGPFPKRNAPLISEL
ncbi:amidase [Candidatus Bathyarchaeota archaeon]|nr:MAG: amidase [Candidatus Bathyarchaeota archaeon]